MENAQLVGLSQQAALRRRLDIIANNLANMATPGYKAEQPIFSEFLMPVARIDGQQGSAAKISYVQDTALFRDFTPGRFQTTGNPLDVAINGSGWLVVQTPEGERYTRNGHLTINAQGQLTTGTGNLVLSDAGPVQIDESETDITIAADGSISTNLGDKGALRIVVFDNEAALKKTGDGLYSSSEPSRPATNASLAQGMLETSNVKAIAEVTAMIAATRSYTQAAKILETSDRLRQSAIEQLGRAPN
ncbi:MAG: flagellar basal-body rod protein FlgF [Alphaproteobacteria bacterium]